MAKQQDRFYLTFLSTKGFEGRVYDSTETFTKKQLPKAKAMITTSYAGYTIVVRKHDDDPFAEGWGEEVERYTLPGKKTF